MEGNFVLAEAMVALELIVSRPVAIEALDLHDENKMGAEGRDQKKFHGTLLVVVEGPKSGVILTH